MSCLRTQRSMHPMRSEPATPRSRVKHSATKPRCSSVLGFCVGSLFCGVVFSLISSFSEEERAGCVI